MKKNHAFRLGIMALALLLGAFVAVTRVHAAGNPSIVGNWEGSLDTGQGSLRLVLHVTQDNANKLTGTVDSPDQNVTGLAVSAITFKTPDLHFEVERIGGSYDGKINTEGNELSGNWKQGPATLALNMKRSGK